MSAKLDIKKRGESLWLIFPDDLVARFDLKEGDKLDATIIEAALAPKIVDTQSKA